MRKAVLLALLLLACAHDPRRAAPACGFETSTAEARYANGAVALAGAWITPNGARRPPAVVILQGSGQSDRSNAWAAAIAQALARCGVAVLLTDKRGSGASGGDWRTASMLDLAADGAAGLAWAAARPGVDHHHLGFLGLSQGGQVAPAAARLSHDADFVIGWVTSAAPMKEALFYELEQTYRQHRLNDDQIAFLQRLPQTSFAWLETGAGWDRYLAVRTQIADSPLAQAVETWPATQNDPYWTFWRANGAFSAAPYWRAATQRGLTGLVVLGERDAADNVDVEGTRRLLAEQAPRVRVDVLPGVGHSLMLSSGALHPRALERTLAAIYGRP